MRTREEQIDSLYHGHNRYSTIMQDAFRNHLIEAERRAEQRVRAEIEASLKDPNTVHVNMLRGSIAMPTWEQFLHLFPKERAEIGRDSERLDWLANKQCQFENRQLGGAGILRCVNDSSGELLVGCYDLREAVDTAREIVERENAND